MANLNRSIGSFLVVVVFLVLIALTTILYGGNAAQQEKMGQNFFWRSGRYVTDTLWAALVGIGNAELTKNFNLNHKLEQKVSEAGFDQISWTEENQGQPLGPENQGGFWAKTQARLAKDWSDNLSGQESGEAHIQWKRNDEGAEIIFYTKDGRERRLILPFKLLSRQTAD